MPKLQGIVVAKKANYLIVKINLNKYNFFELSKLKIANNVRLLCTLRRRLLHLGIVVNVGDYVLLESIDWKAHRAVISNLEPRNSLLTRPPVANATEVFVVLSVKKPEFHVEQASRFLLTAEKSCLKVSVILSKVDLITLEELSLLHRRLLGWGYKPLPISIQNGEGIKDLIVQLKKSSISVLAGPSGVGKSSLLKSILPKESISIGDVSGKLQRGKNTTRHVHLYSLGEGALVADTPGFNRPDLDFRPLELQLLFPELRNQLKNNSCKFRDCLHCDEPGCNIDKHWERYFQYRKLLEEKIISRRQYRED